MTTETLIPSMLIRNWINFGMFDNGVGQWAERIKSLPESWYSAIKLSQGEEAADARLAKKIADEHREAVASGLSGIAEAVYKMALLSESIADKDKLVEAVLFSEDTFGIREGDILISMTTPVIPGCGCMQPDHSMYFGPLGIAGLVMVAIHFKQRSSSCEIRLGFKNRGPAQPTTFGFMALDTTGDCQASKCTIALLSDGVLDAIAGVDAEVTTSWWQAGGHPDATFGFGFTDKMTTMLPQLAEYISESADILDEGCKHTN